MTINTLGGKHVRLAVIFGVISGIVGLLVDILDPKTQVRIPFLGIIIPIIIICTLAIVAYFSIRRFEVSTLRAKLLILFLAVAFLPLSIFIFINFLSTRNTLTEIANATLLSVASQSGNQIDAFFESTTTTLEKEAELSVFEDALKDTLGDFKSKEEGVLQTMKVLVERNPNYLKSYALLNREGKYITGHPHIPGDVSAFLGLSPAIVSGLQISLVSNLSYISPVVIDNKTGETNLYFAARITSKENDILGLLIAVYDSSILQDLIENGNNLAGDASYGILLDENHIILSHGTAPYANFKTVILPNEIILERLKDSKRLPNLPASGLTLNYSEFEEGLKSSRETPHFSLKAGENLEKTSQVAVHRLSSRPWIVAFVQAQEIYLAPAEQQTRFYIILGILFAGITSVAALGASRLIGAPISDLTDQVEQIATGNLSIQVQMTTQDEIGRLASTFNRMTNQISNLLGGLETQVAERTKELEKRAVQLQTAAEVARDSSAIQDLNTLLNHAVHLINQRFGFYHAGIFLLDDQNEYAVLRASNSEGGQAMLAQGHKLKVGETGIVGDTTGKGRPHIALDVGSDSAHFAHPLLPETRSEMALPLKVADEILGALDVQSKQENAFDEEDVTILQILADQLAVAISNSQLLVEVQQKVEELQTAYGEFTQRSWRDWSSRARDHGYRYQGVHIEPVSEEPLEALNAWESKKPIITKSDSQSNLAVPLRLRDTTLGVINLKINSNQIPQDFIEIIKDIGERLALTLDNARLIESTQRTAAREHLITEISSKIRETLDVETVLQTATDKISKSLGLAALDISLSLSQKPTSEDKLASQRTKL
jgi:GAF domain-containing protein/HAMP domain-containing protein